jgi:raffinose/stachyose/melibiose transport system permease protein
MRMNGNTQNRGHKLGLELIGLLVALVYLFPFYIIIVNSFKSKKELFESTLGLPSSLNAVNYLEAFRQLDFLRAFSNSLLISVVSILLLVIFASMAGWKLVRTKNRTSSFLFFMFVGAMVIPFQSVMLPLIALLGRLELLNRIGLVICYLGFQSSLSIFLYHGFVKNVPVELEESATIDGAGELTIFWRVVFPVLQPITVTVVILNAIWIWNDYLLPSLVINKEGMRTIPLQIFLFFGEYTKQWHLAMAGLMLAILPVIIFYFSVQKYIIRGATQGAIK